MERSLQYNYTQSLDSLEDLKLLIDPDLGHFIDQAIFHIIELKARVEKDRERDLLSFSSLQSLLEMRVEEVLKRTLKKNPLISTFSLGWRPSEQNLSKWNTILQSLDLLLPLLNIFRFKKFLDLSIGDEALDLTALISFDDWEEDHRTKVYKITRTFLEKKALLTYKLMGKEGNALYRIRLRLDFSHRESSVYCVDLRDTMDLMLCFSNVFGNYLLDTERSLELEDHHCIEITDRLGMERHKNIPRETASSKTKNVLHFPFLFRPISLIIPRGGEIFSMEELSSSVKFQDEKTIQTGLRTNPLSDNKKIYFLDFFSFFNGEEATHQGKHV